MKQIAKILIGMSILSLTSMVYGETVHYTKLPDKIITINKVYNPIHTEKKMNTGSTKLASNEVAYGMYSCQALHNNKLESALIINATSRVNAVAEVQSLCSLEDFFHDCKKLKITCKKS